MTEKIVLVDDIPVDRNLEMLKGNEYEVVRKTQIGVVVKSHATGEEVMIYRREYREVKHE